MSTESAGSPATPAPGDRFRYFAYGSNLDEARLHEHCPGARLVAIARLDDHRVACTRWSASPRWGGSGVADLVAAPGEAVWGAVWEIDAAHSDALDRQEGADRDPPAYVRDEVEVHTDSGESLHCRTYRVADPDPIGFPPSIAYRLIVLRGARALGLPHDYVLTLERMLGVHLERGAVESSGAEPDAHP